MNNSGQKPAMNLQDSFLNHVRKENLGVIISWLTVSKSEVW